MKSLIAMAVLLTGCAGKSKEADPFRVGTAEAIAVNVPASAIVPASAVGSLYEYTWSPIEQIPIGQKDWCTTDYWIDAERRIWLSRRGKAWRICTMAALDSVVRLQRRTPTEYVIYFDGGIKIQKDEIWQRNRIAVSEVILERKP